jgi:sodium-dependent phosphate cotransporter
MFVFMGGRRHTRAIIEKFLKTHWRGFFIGLGLTIIIPSASLLVTLLVPLAITRIVTLRQAIPYMIGASVGTFIDVLLASFANGEPYSIAGGIVLTMLSAFGVIFIIKGWGANIVYKITRYLSLHIISMKKRNILYFIIGFTIIPLIIVAIFR